MKSVIKLDMDHKKYEQKRKRLLAIIKKMQPSKVEHDVIGVFHYIYVEVL